MKGIDWARVGADLDAHGCAVIERLIPREACDALVALYPAGSRFAAA